MKVIYNNKSVAENQICLSYLIDNLMSSIKPDNEKNRKKRDEIFHVGKFLMLYQNEFQIKKLFERPDFIISNGQVEVGLEHQIVIHEESRELEGFYNNICRLAEDKLIRRSKLPLILANVYFNPMKNRKVNQKNQLIKEIVRLIEHYITTGELIENDIIYHIFSMPHNRICLSANLGAWFQRKIDHDIIRDAIKKKELKIHDYYGRTSLEQWLLLIIGGVGDSSYTVDDNFDIEISTSFVKVFLLVDSYNKLYEIK